MKLSQSAVAVIGLIVFGSVAIADGVTPWRQGVCEQSGSGEEAILTITFKKQSSGTKKRELTLTSKSVAVSTELGKTAIPWKQMGAIDITLASALHPDFKEPGYLLQLALPPSVLPPGDFGVIEPACQTKLRDFMMDIYNRMDKGLL